MKLHVKLAVLLMAAAALAMGACARDRTGAAYSAAIAGVDFSDGVMGAEWILAEIRAAGETVVLDRENHVALGFGDIFTLRFDDGMVYGAAMPNTFRGPYALEDYRISFGNMATTMMAAFMEPEEITEREFFGHLGNVSRWGVANGNLELFAIAEDGTETVLVFVEN